MTEVTNGPTSVGNLGFLAFLLGGALSSLGIGVVSDVFNRGLLGAITAITSAVLVGATFFVTEVFRTLPAEWTVSLLAVWFFMIGGTIYACPTIANSIISGSAKQESSGGLFGTIQTAGALGNAAGPILLGVRASDLGIVAAFPIVTASSLLLAGLFFSLS